MKARLWLDVVEPYQSPCARCGAKVYYARLADDQGGEATILVDLLRRHVERGADALGIADVEPHSCAAQLSRFGPSPLRAGFTATVLADQSRRIVDRYLGRGAGTPEIADVEPHSCAAQLPHVGPGRQEEVSSG